MESIYCFNDILELCDSKHVRNIVNKYEIYSNHLSERIQFYMRFGWDFVDDIKGFNDEYLQRCEQTETMNVEYITNDADQILDEINRINNEGTIIKIIFNNNVRALKYVLNHGKKIFNWMLIPAIEYNKLKIIKCLCKHGLNLDRIIYSIQSQQSLCKHDYDFNVIKYLWDNCPVNQFLSIIPETHFRNIVESCSLEEFIFMHKNEFIHGCFNFGMVIGQCVQHGRSDILKYLFENKEINSKIGQYYHIRRITVTQKNVDCVRMIIDKGCKIDSLEFKLDSHLTQVVGRELIDTFQKKQR